MKYKFRHYKGVRYVAPNNPAPDSFTRCGHCERAWDDSKSTALTPAPSARCPFEYWHRYAPRLNKRTLREAAAAIAGMQSPSIETILRAHGYPHEANCVRDLVQAAPPVRAVQAASRPKAGEQGRCAACGHTMPISGFDARGRRLKRACWDDQPMLPMPSKKRAQAAQCPKCKGVAGYDYILIE